MLLMVEIFISNFNMEKGKNIAILDSEFRKEEKKNQRNKRNVNL
jgi:hypothetical protein